MAENTTEVLTGAAVLAAGIGFALYLGTTTGVTDRTSGTYELRASFRSIEGVSIGTDVRLAGVKVGSVTNVSLNPKTYRADMQFAVKDGIELSDDSSISISSEGLLGGNFVELIPGGSPFTLEPQGEIENTQGAVSLISLLLKFVSGSNE